MSRQIRRSSAVMVFLLAAVASAWLISRGVSLALQQSNPRLALLFYSGNPEALVRINEDEQDPVRKAARARIVLAQRPLDGRAYRQLAEVRLDDNDPQAARQLYTIAARYTPRDRQTQAWLADDALSRSDFRTALEHLDLLLRIDPLLRKRFHARLAELATQQNFRLALVRKLAVGPVWRSEFLADWTGGTGGLEPLASAITQLNRLGAPLSSIERAGWVDRLLRERQWSAAHAAWAAPSRADRRQPAAMINGGFERVPAGAFDWRLDSFVGGRIDRIASDSGSTALRVEFYGQRVDFNALSQLLVLDPGAYRLSARAKLEELRSDRGLAWVLRCAPDGPTLGTGPALSGTSGWREISFNFSVPMGCPAQLLRLELAARTPVEHQVRGVAWFDDVSVCRLDPSAISDADAPPALPRESPQTAAASDRVQPFAGGFLAIVRSVVGSTPNAAGNHDADVPVGP